MVLEFDVESALTRSQSCGGPMKAVPPRAVEIG